MRKRARRDFVQQRLPDVDQRAVDQRDPGLAVPAQPIAELGREHQAARAATDHDNVVGRCQDGIGTNCRRRGRCRRALQHIRDRLTCGGRDISDHRHFSSQPTVKPVAH